MKKIITVLLMLLSVSVFAQTADEYFKKGIEAAHHGHLDNAIENLKKALELSPGLADYHLNLGVLYANKKDYDNAVTEIQASINANSSNSMSHYVMAMLMEKKKDKVKALSEWETVLRLKPANDLEETAEKHIRHIKERLNEKAE